MTHEELIQAAKSTARALQLDPALVCAVVEQESTWNTHAIRFEPAFYTKYVQPLNLSQTESFARSFSWGLMQVMGQVAREAGFQANLPALCEPIAGLDIGCKVLKAKLSSHPSSVEAGLLAWNGGGNPNYPREVLARVEKYQ